MPFFIDQDDLTPAQLAARGLDNIRREIAERMLAGPAARLRNGLPYVIQVVGNAPVPLNNAAGQMRVTVIIRWWHAEAANCPIGEKLFFGLLDPDPKGNDANGNPIQPFEATVGGMRFDPIGDGWERVL